MEVAWGGETPLHNDVLTSGTRKKKYFDIEKNTAIEPGALSLCRGRFPRSPEPRQLCLCAARSATQRPTAIIAGVGAGRGGGCWSRLASSCRSSSPTRGARRLGGGGTSPVGVDVMGAFSRKPGRSGPASCRCSSRRVVVDVLGGPPRTAPTAPRGLSVQPLQAAGARLPAYPATPCRRDELD